MKSTNTQVQLGLASARETPQKLVGSTIKQAHQLGANYIFLYPEQLNQSVRKIALEYGLQVISAEGYTGSNFADLMTSSVDL